MSPVRYPLQPLVDYLTAIGGHDERDWVDDPATGHRHLSNRRIAFLCNTTRRAIQGYTTDGVPDVSADAIATHLGLHVRVLWGDEYNRREFDPLEAIPHHNRRAARLALSRGESIEHLYSTLRRPTPTELRRTRQPA